jgi:hypothetical protein
MCFYRTLARIVGKAAAVAPLLARRLALAGAAIIPLDVGVAIAAEPFAVKKVVLYQPNEVLVDRLGNDAGPFGNYIKQIEIREATVFANAGQHPGASGAIVVAIRPGKQSRAWIVLGSNSLPAALVSQIKAEAETVLPVSVQRGPVAFAVLFEAWGGGQPITDAAHPVPIPLEWRAAAPEMLPDRPLSRVWPQ